MDYKAEIACKAPSGDCNAILVENIVRQGTVLGPGVPWANAVMKVSLTKVELST